MLWLYLKMEVLLFTFVVFVLGFIFYAFDVLSVYYSAPAQFIFIRHYCVCLLHCVWAIFI